MEHVHILFVDVSNLSNCIGQLEYQPELYALTNAKSASAGRVAGLSIVVQIYHQPHQPHHHHIAFHSVQSYIFITQSF